MSSGTPNTHSAFIYGFEVDQTNNKVDFKEGATFFTATIDVGSYSMTEYAAELARVLNAEGALTYTVTINRTTRVFTVAASGTFSLLVATGAHLGTSAFPMMGFTGADRTAAASYAGDNATGSQYNTQFLLQGFVGSDDFQGAAEASISRSASGRKEVVKFGTEKFLEFAFRYVTDRNIGGECFPIRKNLSGVSQLRLLMQHMVLARPFEFMVDEDDLNTFETMILESGFGDQKGVSYKLKEMVDKGLVGFFETGTLKFRVIE